MLVSARTTRDRLSPRAAIVELVLQREFLRVRLASKQRARAAISGPVLGITAFGDPIRELIAIEMGITAIGQRGECTVCEREQRGIGAFHRPLRIPSAGQSADALNHAAA